jgi:Mg2+ and Co2+ transporter CorA
MAIAAAAKRDSFAMKTIAVMTMVFLPATFLATIFSLPVLEWEYKRDIQMDGFRLYWAVTIPSTAVVFVVWALVTQRSWILDKALKRRKRVDRLGKKNS